MLLHLSSSMVKLHEEFLEQIPSKIILYWCKNHKSDGKDKQNVGNVILLEILTSQRENPNPQGHEEQGSEKQ